MFLYPCVCCVINTNLKAVLRPGCNPPPATQAPFLVAVLVGIPAFLFTPAKNSHGDAVGQDVQPAGFPVFVLVLLAWAEPVLLHLPCWTPEVDSLHLMP